MNILIDIGHPAHVHVFRHYHDEMTAQGHCVLFTTKDKECAVALLEAYGLPFELIGTPFSGVVGKLWGLFHFGRKIFRLAKKFEADMFISISSMYAAHVAFLMGKPHIVLDDTEHSRFEHMLYRPFSKYILTPTCFEKNMGPKHIRYEGYHELAYLHPNRFKANNSVLADMGLNSNEHFSLLRFVSWNAGHDIKQTGLSIDQKRALVKQLEQKGKVFISSEKMLPEDLEPYRIRIKPQDMHTVLQAATLYLGEGASMASECAMLGTPAIYVNSLNAGTLKEQEAYGLIHSLRSHKGVLETAAAIWNDIEFDKKNMQARDRMLAEKIDVTTLLCRLSNQVLQNSTVTSTLITKLNYGRI